LSNDFYVDLLSGASTIEDAINMQKDVSSLLQTGRLTLRKWASNHSYILGYHSKGGARNTINISLDNEDGVTTLGLLWNPKHDQLQEQSYPEANNIFHSEYKTQGASYHICHL
jgi:hypothetical protein